jgi:hypothetical protein
MSTRSIKNPADQIATHADILAVIDAASASIAGLEARIEALEQRRDSGDVISLAPKTRENTEDGGPPFGPKVQDDGFEGSVTL